MSQRRFVGRRALRASVVPFLILGLALPRIGYLRASGAAASTAPSASSSAGVVARITNLFNALQEAESEIPRETFDPNAVAIQAGSDSTKIFEWVRDQTSYIPYRGTLRGATGVLMDHLGNSLDRALCLAAVLRAAGYTCRLANAQLTDQEADGLLARIRPVPPLSYGFSSADSAPADRQAAGYATKYGLDLSSSQRDTDTTEAMNLASGIVQRATDQSPFIIAAVGKPKDGDSGDHARAVAAIKDLWWVQFQQKNVWKDLDPTAGDARFGDASAKAARTVVFDAKTGRFALEPALLHLLKIRVVTEKWEAGKLTESVLLEHEIRPAEAIGQRIAFTNMPTKWPELPDKDPPEGGVNFLKNAATNTHEWLPLLSIDDQRIFRAGVNDAGVVNESPVNPSGAAELSRGVGGLFGAALGGEKPKKAESFLTAQWIDYEIETPGAARQTIRRDVFDLIGPVARKAVPCPKPIISDDQRIQRCLSMNGALEILPQPCRLSPEFCAHLTVRRMLSNRSALLGLFEAQGAQGLDASRVRSLAAKMTPLPGRIYDFAQLRWLCSPVVADVYLDRLNVVALGEHLQFAGGSALTGLRQFDIVDNDVAVRSSATDAAFSARVTQGVTDTNAEALVLKTTDMAVANNAGEYLNKTSGEMGAWAVAAKPDDPVLASGGISGDLKARLAADISASKVVLVHRNPTSDRDACWWRIDPQTGQTLGFAPNGAGAAATEYVVVWSIEAGIAGFGVCEGISWLVGNHSVQRMVKCAVIGVGVGAGLGGILAPAFATTAKIIAIIVSVVQAPL